MGNTLVLLLRSTTVADDCRRSALVAVEPPQPRLADRPCCRESIGAVADGLAGDSANGLAEGSADQERRWAGLVSSSEGASLCRSSTEKT